jgi:hypothetical protein
MKSLLALAAAVTVLGAAIAPPASAHVYVYRGHSYAYRYHGHYYHYRHNGHYYNHRHCYVSNGVKVCRYH